MFLDVLFITILVFFAYQWGKKSSALANGSAIIDYVRARAAIPIIVADNIDGHYYLFEKDTQNFICQTDKLEDIPELLYERKKISLALLLFPEEAPDEQFWCVNGKLKVASK